MANPKEVAGRMAAELVHGGMTLGLGTGSTVRFALERLAERIRDEALKVRGVPTSLDTERRARELQIPLTDLEEVEELDLTIDGADEIDHGFAMIKGGGGALLREKVVACVTRREVIVVGEGKVVERLGVHFPLPVEVVPYALPVVRRRLADLGSEPELRLLDDGHDYRTDNGNAILDCRFRGGIPDPAALEAELARIPGIVESGLFVGLAHVLVVGHADGHAEVRERSG